MGKAWLDDHAVGERSTTPARTITEADGVACAALTGDSRPLTCWVAATKLPCGREG